ncbi:unnamed protein product [Protopolystoma xenopodis]|uniref:Uncharacterized protein n=1 Tax=Protopolystoma xenopodis TaxID=117903 RepID=A0A448XM49_9PLAT|nr:unnamed protein product [Protopolystoma xenopodis]
MDLEKIASLSSRQQDGHAIQGKAGLTELLISPHLFYHAFLDLVFTRRLLAIYHCPTATPLSDSFASGVQGKIQEWRTFSTRQAGSDRSESASRTKEGGHGDAPYLLG